MKSKADQVADALTDIRVGDRVRFQTWAKSQIAVITHVYNQEEFWGNVGLTGRWIFRKHIIEVIRE